MRVRPLDLSDADVVAAGAEGWLVHAEAAAYVPEGGGSHHWRLTDRRGESLFVTVDDLDDKDWMGQNRESVFNGLRRALGTAALLRDEAGLDFVVGPIASVDGEVVRRLGPRYAISVYPFLVGRSYPFGPHTDPERRGQVLDMVIALHGATATAARDARRDEPAFGGRRDLEVALEHPDRPWEGGPFADVARLLVAEHAAALLEVVRGFDQLVEATRRTRTTPVITHGEPHASNVMSVDGRIVLIDWDTVALGPPERDLWLIASEDGGEISRYQEASGRHIDSASMSLYRLRWYLDDVASAVRLFRRHHQQTEDTQRWWDGLAPRLEQLPAWNRSLAELLR
ncbi:MAG TPA: phosphotransferase [Acidimicrobiales bacterium]|nr:phosphotransferase [Acidimicrobiales bacterium]